MVVINDSKMLSGVRKQCQVQAGTGRLYFRDFGQANWLLKGVMCCSNCGLGFVFPMLVPLVFARVAARVRILVSQKSINNQSTPLCHSRRAHLAVRWTLNARLPGSGGH